MMLRGRGQHRAFGNMGILRQIHDHLSNRRSGSASILSCQCWACKRTAVYVYNADFHGQQGRNSTSRVRLMLTTSAFGLVED
jgi:hypothetical protein